MNGTHKRRPRKEGENKVLTCHSSESTVYVWVLLSFAAVFCACHSHGLNACSTHSCVCCSHDLKAFWASPCWPCVRHTGRHTWGVPRRCCRALPACGSCRGTAASPSCGTCSVTRRARGGSLADSGDRSPAAFDAVTTVTIRLWRNEPLSKELVPPGRKLSRTPL